eukprot:EG_transcript_4480
MECTTAFEVDVMYPYQSAEKNQISLSPKEKILVLQADASGWWIGRNSKGEVGIFPSTYTSLGQSLGQENDPLKGLDKHNKAVLWKVIDQLAQEKRQLTSTVAQLKESHRKLQERLAATEAVLAEAKAQVGTTSPSPSPSNLQHVSEDRISPPPLPISPQLPPAWQPAGRPNSRPRAELEAAARSAQRLAHSLGGQHRLLTAGVTGQLQSFRQTLQQCAGAFTAMQQRMLELDELYRKEVRERKALYNAMQDLKGKVRVYCRLRPPLTAERARGDALCVTMDMDNVRVDEPKRPPIVYELDACFAPERPQEDLFEEVKPVITSVLDGYNVCVFAYGQTGSGKTYTMEGPASSRGISYRTVHRLFEEIAARRPAYQYTVQVGVIEVYNDNLYDMLRKNNREEKVELRTVNGRWQPVDATLVAVDSVEEVLPILTKALAARCSGSTQLNERSSRSHCLVTFHIAGSNQASRFKVSGKLNLIDLAGSERTAKSKAEGERLCEANSINRSLSNLGRVICALHQKQTHIPFRDSKLTMLLQDSLSGDSKTILIATISPTLSCSSETLSTLAFASSVRKLELGEAKRSVTSLNGKPGRPRCKSESTRRHSHVEPGHRSWSDVVDLDSSDAGTD